MGTHIDDVVPRSPFSLCTCVYPCCCCFFVFFREKIGSEIRPAGGMFSYDLDHSIRYNSMAYRVPLTYVPLSCVVKTQQNDGSMVRGVMVPTRSRVFAATVGATMRTRTGYSERVDKSGLSPRWKKHKHHTPTLNCKQRMNACSYARVHIVYLVH